MDNLLVLTTAGRLHWLREAIFTLRDSLDVLVVDDAALGDEIRDFCKQKGLAFITKAEPKGLTNSWNTAYRFFRENEYKRCILSNDDVKFPRGFSRGLLDGTDKFSVVVPISNKPAITKAYQKSQWLFPYTDLPCGDIDSVQEFLEKKHRELPYIETGSFNGFCFAFSRNISRYSFSDIELFNPSRINIGNEVEFRKRIIERRGIMAVCRTSYVFHWKAGTYNELGLKRRNQLWRK